MDRIEIEELGKEARSALFDAERSAQIALTNYAHSVQMRYYALLAYNEEPQRTLLEHIGDQVKFEGIWTTGISVDSYDLYRSQARKAEQLVEKLETIITDIPRVIQEEA